MCDSIPNIEYGEEKKEKNSLSTDPSFLVMSSVVNVVENDGEATSQRDEI